MGHCIKFFEIAGSFSFCVVTPGCLLDPSLGNHEYMTANGVKFHYVVKGSRTKPLMVLLHGFPEVRGRKNPRSQLYVFRN